MYRKPLLGRLEARLLAVLTTFSLVLSIVQPMVSWADTLNIFADGFDDGGGFPSTTIWTYAGSGWSSTGPSGSTPDSSSKKAKVSGSVTANPTATTSAAGLLWVATSTAGYSNIKLTFSYRIDEELESGDSFDVEWSTDGSNWNSVLTLGATTTTSWATISQQSLSGAENATELRLRFRANFSTGAGDHDEAQIDAVTLTGDTSSGGGGGGGGNETATLTVIKEVVGGTATSSDFTIAVTGSESSQTFSGSLVGEVLTLPVGTYTIGETGDPNVIGAYSGSFSDTCAAGSVTLTANASVTCRITNTYNSEAGATTTLTIIKEVVGSQADPSSFAITVTRNGNTSSTTINGSATGTVLELEKFTYIITETAPNYTLTFSENCASGIVDLTEGPVTCTLTNTFNRESETGELRVVTNVINDNGGTATSSDFTGTITGENIATTTFPGTSVGNTFSFTGSYGVTSATSSTYTQTLSESCSGTLAAGATTTCTVTYDDIASQEEFQASVMVQTLVVNDNSGTATSSDFDLEILANGATSTMTGNAEPTSITLSSSGAFSITPQATSSYTFSVSGTCAGTLENGSSTTCTVTYNDIPRETEEDPFEAFLNLVTFVTNDNTGTATPADFTAAVANNGATTSHAGSASGVIVTLTANTFTVTPAVNSTYTVSMSGSCSGTITDGATSTCTLTYDDIASSTNDGGSTGGGGNGGCLTNCPDNGGGNPGGGGGGNSTTTPPVIPPGTGGNPGGGATPGGTEPADLGAPIPLTLGTAEATTSTTTDTSTFQLASSATPTDDNLQPNSLLAGLGNLFSGDGSWLSWLVLLLLLAGAGYWGYQSWKKED